MFGGNRIGSMSARPGFSRQGASGDSVGRRLGSSSSEGGPPQKKRMSPSRSSGESQGSLGGSISNLAGAALSDEDEKEIVSDYEPEDEEEAAYMEAFPDNNWDADKMAAMKEGVRICVMRNAGGEYGGEEPAPKKGPDLALILGEPKKKA